MRIPLIQVITKLELGGAQQLALELANGVRKDLFCPYLLCGEGGLLDEEAKALPDVATHFIPHLIREIRPFSDLLALREIKRRIRSIISQYPKGTPAIVHTHSSKAGILGRWAAWLEEVDVIMHTYHGFGFNDWQRPWIRRSYQLIEMITSRVTHALVMVSKANMAKAHACGIRAREVCRVIYGGIRVAEFWDAKAEFGGFKEALGLDQEDKVVTMISCLKPQKSPLDFVGVADLVFKEFNDVKFLLVGDGELRSQVIAEIRRRGLEGRVRHLGWRRDVPAILGVTDVFVLTSLWEGFPLVLPQAMAVGVPAVVTEVDGSPEAIIDGVNGFVVKPRDIQGMAKKVIELLRNPDLRKRMGEEGRKRVKEFDIEEMVKKQQELYLELLRGLPMRKGKSK